MAYSKHIYMMTIITFVLQTILSQSQVLLKDTHYPDNNIYETVNLYFKIYKSDWNKNLKWLVLSLEDGDKVILK